MTFRILRNGLFVLLAGTASNAPSALAEPRTGAQAFENRLAAQRAVAEVETMKREVVARALESLYSPDEGVRYFAIRIVGVLQAVEGAERLVEVIDFLPRSVPLICRSTCETESYFPAAKALLSIGPPGLHVVRRLLTATEDARKRRLGIWILIRMLGQETAICEVEQWAQESAGIPESSRQRALLERTRREVKAYTQLFELPGLPGSGPFEDGKGD